LEKVLKKFGNELYVSLWGIADEEWNTAGRYISTLASTCFNGRPQGEQVSHIIKGWARAYVEVPLFFHTLHRLHTKFPVATILAEFDVSQVQLYWD
jgi:hypothetical protein